MCAGVRDENWFAGISVLNKAMASQPEFRNSVRYGIPYGYIVRINVL